MKPRSGTKQKDAIFLSQMAGNMWAVYRGKTRLGEIRWVDRSPFKVAVKIKHD
jgi:hypothetical protein